MPETISVTDVLLTVVGFLVVYTLNGIKGEIKEVKTSMRDLTHQLTEIDRRVVVVETQCGVNHAFKRRSTDKEVV